MRSSNMGLLDARRQATSAAWFPRTLQSSLFKADPQLQKTLAGGRENVIGLGSSGASVTLLQQALRLLGYSRFFKKPPDLHFGDETRKAVEQLQEDHGLVSDGLVGTKTLETMDRLIAQRDKVNSGSTSSTSPVEDEETLPLRPVSIGILQRVGARLSGKVSVTPTVGLSILDNMASTREQFSFLPSKGEVGQCSWFTLEGDPYVGKLEGRTVGLEVSIEPHKDALIFKEADLVERMKERARSFDAEASYRKHKNIPKEQILSRKQLDAIKKLARELPERQIWNEVGKAIRDHSSKMGIVEYDGADRGEWSLSKGRPGKTIAIADPKRITIKGGIGAMLEVLKQQGHEAEPTVREAATELICQKKGVATVKAVFKYGGRILIVVGVAVDAYRIYRAENKLRETLKVAGGWAGAGLFASAFAMWWTPADVAGPVAWVIHGVGTLIAGGVGYIVGSETMAYVYEIVLENK